MTTRRAHFEMMMILTAALILPSSLTARAAERPKYEIKFASVAPEGTTWMNVMHDLDRQVREATHGDVGFKLYAGGVQGDEPDVIRKMRFGQLQGAGFTGNGLGEILPSMRILELPFLYRNKAEIDYILDQFTDYFDNAFRDKGYVLLGWTEVGYVYFFSNVPIRGIEDLKGIKVWTWQGDPLAAKLFQALNVTPVPLSVTEVLTALQTGMVDAVYTSPMAAISLQWFTRTKYMNTAPLTNSMGAVLMKKSLFDKIPEDEQKALLNISRKKLRELTLLTRQDNQKSITELEKAGLEMVPPPSDEEMEAYRKVGMEVRQELVGELYPDSLLQNILKALDDYRANGE